LRISRRFPDAFLRLSWPFVLPVAPRVLLQIVRPLLPEFLDRVELRRLRVGWATVDLLFQRGPQGIHVDVKKLDGKLDVGVEESRE
jgi:hypothetical protein